jgi:CIC family chloride channel protein
MAMRAQLRTRLAAQIDGSSRAAPLLLGALVGLAAGLGAVAFSALIEGVHALFFDLLWEDLLGSARWSLLLLPALGGLLVGPFAFRLAHETRGPGVAEILLAVETRAGRIHPRTAVTKSIATALTIGSGGSAGKEGPIAQIGASVGSAVGQALRLSPDTVTLLLAAGAAAGVAATFNAPIAGVFFALEVILRSFNTRNFSVVVLAAVIATVTSVALSGGDPFVDVPAYPLEHPAEVPLYAVLGVIAGVVGVGFMRGLYGTEERFARLPLPRLLLPALGGLLVGALALWDDGVLGLGDEVLESALLGETPAGALLLLVVLKLVATSITIGSGGSGGAFGPSLLMGAALGGAFGELMHRLLPSIAVTPEAYATVGMGALFAGMARAPITSMLILFELTRDYDLILPLMTAVVAATVVSQLLVPWSIYTFKLERSGVHVEEELAPVSLMQTIRVADAMSPVTLCVAPETPAAEIIRQSSSDPESVTLMLDERGAVTGIITNTDLNRALADGRPAEPAEAIASRGVMTVFPDETLDDALRIFAGHAITALPVVERDADAMMPVGVLRRSDITQAYAQVVGTRETAERRRRLAPVAGDDVRYLELEVGRGSRADGRLLAELGLTEDAVIVAVRHRGATHIPRGHTRLYAGDRVTVIAALGAVGEARAHFDRPAG